MTLTRGELLNLRNRRRWEAVKALGLAGARAAKALYWSIMDDQQWEAWMASHHRTRANLPDQIEIGIDLDIDLEAITRMLEKISGALVGLKVSVDSTPLEEFARAVAAIDERTEAEEIERMRSSEMILKNWEGTLMLNRDIATERKGAK